LKYYPTLAKDIADKKDHTDKGQYGLFFDEAEEKDVTDNFEKVPEFSETELIIYEKEVLGFLLTRNPLDRFREIIESKVNKNIGDIEEADNGKMIIIAGIISSFKIVKTKKDNSEMAFLTLYDDSGSIEITVFPKTFAKLRSMLAVNKVLLMKGKVSMRQDTLSVMLENAVDLERAAL
jgi:DNA polymerase-3 subunit alpha